MKFEEEKGFELTGENCITHNKWSFDKLKQRRDYNWT